MNPKIYILALAAVTVGLVELVVGGILPQIAADLGVSVGTAGQLITVFAAVFAVAGPVLLTITSKVGRKKLMLITMAIFVGANVMTYFSATYMMIMVARVITSAAAALIVVLAITIAGKIALPHQRAKSIGLVFMGVSSALVLGVPIGIVLADIIGWRALFLIIAVMAFLVMVMIYFLFEDVPNEAQIPLKTQIKALGNIKLAGAHFATMFMLAGHYAFYAYFAPFLESTMHLSQTWISICYFLFGIAAVGGGALGGMLADKLGSRKAILSVISVFAIVLFILPHTVFSFPLFLIVMMLWGTLSWSIAPPQQNYIIELDPYTAELHQSFNNSALQIGIALASGIGGVVIGQTGSTTTVASVGSAVVVLAFLCALFALMRPLPKSTSGTVE